MELSPTAAGRVIELSRTGGRQGLPPVRRPARARAPGRRPARPAHQGRPARGARAAGDRRAARRDHADRLRRHRPGRAHGQGHHLRRRPGGRGHAAAGRAGLPGLPRPRPLHRRRALSCPPGSAAELDYATQRMVNLMGAWHSQLIEVLGAMGIREVRRLRGEVGRAMFLEDIEREAFGDLDRVAPSAGVLMTHRLADKSSIDREVAPRARALPQRPRQVQGQPLGRLASRAASASRSARTACTSSPRATPSPCGPRTICASARTAPRARPLRRPVPAEGPHRDAQPQRRCPGRSALVERPDPLHLAPGRDRPRAAERPGIPHGAPPAADSTGCASSSSCPGSSRPSSRHSCRAPRRRGRSTDVTSAWT